MAKAETLQKCKNIIALIPSDSKSVKSLCQSEGIHFDTFFTYLNENKELSDLYARAKELQAEMMVEEIIDISNHVEEDHTPFTGGNVVQRDRLRIDARKWVAAKLLPKKYGDKLNLEHSGEIGLPNLSGASDESIDKVLKESGIK